MSSELNNFDNSRGAFNTMSRDLYGQVLKYFVNGDKVLNLGCGAQYNLEKLLKLTKSNTSITSIDIVDLPMSEYVDTFIHADVEKELDINQKFDVVCFFELLEHIDKTDILIRNCTRHMKDEGLLVFSFPNLASIYGRLELLLGFQPHILEISNEYSNFGTGVFGKINNATGKAIHHIRGLTCRAVKELVEYNNLTVRNMIGWEARTGKLLSKFPQIAPVDIFICKKNS